jgi:hypothetical protein
MWRSNSIRCDPDHEQTHGGENEDLDDSLLALYTAPHSLTISKNPSSICPSGRGGEKKNSQPCRDSNPLSSSPQPSTTLLSYPGPPKHNRGKKSWNLFTLLACVFLQAQWYSAGLRAGWSGVRIPVGARNCSHHRVHTGSGAHPPSYWMGTRGSFPGGKAAGALS